MTFFAWQSLRVPRLKRVRMLDRWYAANVGVQVAFIASLWAVAGWRAVLYLTLSSIFAIGLHPVGARWIQEHYLTSGTKGQETFSYYGPLNLVAFNVGYHNEHHDLMIVPWSRLPRHQGDGARSSTTGWWRTDRGPRFSSASCSTRRSASTAAGSGSRPPR